MAAVRADRRAVGVAVLAVLAGLLAMGLLAPDSGPPVVRRAAPAIAAFARAERPLPTLARAPAPPPTGAEAPEVPPDLPLALPYTPPARLEGPGSPIDPDQTFTADLRGMAAAAVSRRDRFVACREEALDRQGDGADPNDRLTLEVVLGLDGVAHADVIRGPDDDDFYGCIERALADARFEPPASEQRMIWPVVTTGVRDAEGPRDLASP